MDLRPDGLGVRSRSSHLIATVVRSTSRVPLVPERDVEECDGALLATSNEPWLDLGPAAAFAGRFVEIAYSLSLWDEPVRPVFRFWGEGRCVDRIGAGPIAGRAMWVGRVPPGTTRMSVSPTCRTGRFDFSVDGIRTRLWASLLADGFRWHPRPARSAVLTRLIGWGPESDVNLAWATSSMPVSAYEFWRRSHERTFDPAGLERPRFDWAASPPIRLVVASDGDADSLRRTIASLQAQLFPVWQAYILGSDAPPADARGHVETLDAMDRAVLADGDGLLGVLAAGDTLRPEALAILAEQAHRMPAARLFYGDEVGRNSDGTGRPVLKPGWSPHLQASHPYLGRSIFMRGFTGWNTDERLGFLTSGELPRSVAASLGVDQVVPLRRILVETSVAQPSGRAVKVASVALSPTSATAAIVIPTRDHPALLRRLLASIRATAPTGRFQIVVVDNASVEASTKTLLAEIARLADTRVIDDARPFNFSRICNDAAASVTSDVLLFLNDDMEVLGDGWLDRLIAHAMDPAVGAVGAKLTYPDGRLQHIGVMVGMGESAGHFGSLAAGDDPGWLGRNAVVHEVSAVTGACLAVERRKFVAVGGFDAEYLPIELSDIDLCLKLNACGWQTLVDPTVHITHEESATRGGATLRRLSVYDDERSVFVERWRHVIRDDPFFHPGLSLYRWQEALG